TKPCLSLRGKSNMAKSFECDTPSCIENQMDNIDCGRANRAFAIFATLLGVISFSALSSIFYATDPEIKTVCAVTSVTTGLLSFSFFALSCGYKEDSCNRANYTELLDSKDKKRCC
ncbi:MAG: hypothetical protein AAGG80_07835, partial [Pseudomonadota bacterium]